MTCNVRDTNCIRREGLHFFHHFVWFDLTKIFFERPNFDIISIFFDLMQQSLPKWPWSWKPSKPFKGLGLA